MVEWHKHTFGFTNVRSRIEVFNRKLREYVDKYSGQTLFCDIFSETGSLFPNSEHVQVYIVKTAVVIYEATPFFNEKNGIKKLHFTVASIDKREVSEISRELSALVEGA